MEEEAEEEEGEGAEDLSEEGIFNEDRNEKGESRLRLFLLLFLPKHSRITNDS